MSKQTFLVAFKVYTDCKETLATEEMVEWAHEQLNGCDVGEASDVFVGELKKNVGWNKNIDVLFQLWLEERCKGMWP